MKNKNNNTVDYWVACSGGVDSVVLVHLFHQLKKSFGILHCNFQLRGEASDHDEAFVKSLGLELNVPVKIKHFNIDAEKENTQLAARNLRYDWFESVKNQTDSKIALAHHADDQVETFFLQLERGGVEGLTAMPLERNGYIRPLLNYDKKTIIALAKQQNWIWREDQSNQKEVYQRNAYRLQFLPVLEKAGLKRDEVLELISDYQKLFKLIHEWQASLPSIYFDAFSFSAWDQLPILLQKAVLKSQGIPSNQLEEVQKLRQTIKGSALTYEKTKLWNEGDHFYFEQRFNNIPVPELKIEKINPPDIKFKKGALFMDPDKLSGTLKIRLWRLGDRFQPLGMIGKKRISDFLTDVKVPAHQKATTYIAEDNEGIVAVMGYQISQRVRIDRTTKRAWKLSIKLPAE